MGKSKSVKQKKKEEEEEGPKASTGVGSNVVVLGSREEGEGENLRKRLVK